MDLQISGTVVEILDEMSGESQNGPWRKQDFILETAGQYPKKVCITQWGDKIDQFNVNEDEQLTAYIDIQSREYKERWYTDVKAWKIEKGSSGGTANTSASPSPTSQPASKADDPFEVADSNDDDGLPF